jgi:hypothetical protein
MPALSEHEMSSSLDTALVRWSSRVQPGFDFSRVPYSVLTRMYCTTSKAKVSVNLFATGRGSRFGNDEALDLSIRCECHRLN